MSTCWMCSGFEKSHFVHEKPLKFVACVLGCYCDDGFMVNDEDGECIPEDTAEEVNEKTAEETAEDTPEDTLTVFSISGETFDNLELENEII